MSGNVELLAGKQVENTVDTLENRNRDHLSLGQSCRTAASTSCALRLATSAAAVSSATVACLAVADGFSKPEGWPTPTHVPGWQFVACKGTVQVLARLLASAKLAFAIHQAGQRLVLIDTQNKTLRKLNLVAQMFPSHGTDCSKGYESHGRTHLRRGPRGGRATKSSTQHLLRSNCAC